jgi:cell division protein FtsN
MIRFVTVILAALLMLGACSPKEPVKNDPWLSSPEENAEYEVQADTLTYDFLAESQAEAESAPTPEPDLPVLDESPTEAPPETVAAVPVATTPPAPEALTKPAGDSPLFYVQIFASNNRKGAEDLALKADGKLDQTVRILFLEPYYKVLVGGFTDRDEAVLLRRELTDLGYKGAWIVEY